MKKTKAMLVRVAVAAALLAATTGPSVWAQHPGHSDPPPSAQGAWFGKAKGKVLQFDQNSITIEREKKGKTEKILFLITDRTDIKGVLEPGADVTVHYREESGSRTATKIEVQKAK
jgi:hypothetical protein